MEKKLVLNVRSHIFVCHFTRNSQLETLQIWPKGVLFTQVITWPHFTPLCWECFLLAFKIQKFVLCNIKKSNVENENLSCFHHKSSIEMTVFIDSMHDFYNFGSQGLCLDIQNNKNHNVQLDNQKVHASWKKKQLVVGCHLQDFVEMEQFLFSSDNSKLYFQLSFVRLQFQCFKSNFGAPAGNGKIKFS